MSDHLYIDFQNKDNLIKLAFFIAVASKDGYGGSIRDLLDKFDLPDYHKGVANNLLTHATLILSNNGSGYLPSYAALQRFIASPVSDRICQQLPDKKSVILAALSNMSYYWKLDKKLSYRAMRALWNLL